MTSDSLPPPSSCFMLCLAPPQNAWCLAELGHQFASAAEGPAAMPEVTSDNFLQLIKNAPAN